MPLKRFLSFIAPPRQVYGRASPFGEVKAAFERRLGLFDPVVYKELAEGGDPETAKAKIAAMASPSGFMLFRTSDHGSLLRIVGQQRKALQCLLGNPLFAVEMTRHALGEALYAPLRVLIYEDDRAKTDIAGRGPPATIAPRGLSRNAESFSQFFPRHRHGQT
jgi:hypothetical protein